MSAPICKPVFCKTWRTSAIVRAVGAVAADMTGGAVGQGVFDPELDMVVGVCGGDEGFCGEIDDSSSEDSELIVGGGDWGCWDDTLGY